MEGMSLVGGTDCKAAYARVRYRGWSSVHQGAVQRVEQRTSRRVEGCIHVISLHGQGRAAAHRAAQVLGLHLQGEEGAAAKKKLTFRRPMNE